MDEVPVRFWVGPFFRRGFDKPYIVFFVEKNMLKRGQVALFVIIGLAIVVAVGTFIFLMSRGGFSSSSSTFEPIFSAYAGCIERETRDALALAGSQGGYVSFDDFQPGSDYAPFSSHLFYLGSALPYWYGITGNGLVKEAVPSRTQIESSIASFIDSRLRSCDVSSFVEQGYVIDLSPSHTSVRILDDSVEVTTDAPLRVSRDSDTALQGTHRVKISSQFGALYAQAVALYNSERSNSFLENYAVDALRSYAPVDGVAAQCSPMIWKTSEVVENISRGLDLTYASLKFKGSDYALSKPEHSYFVVNQEARLPTRVIYSSDWPQKIEVTPADNLVMVANPLGNQAGLGTLGFCYVPYHFVYDVQFPVVFQIYTGEELFQFPVAVIVDNNVARVAASGLPGVAPNSDVCGFRESPITISTFDSNLNPVSAHIQYQCFDQICDLGDTHISNGDAVLDTLAPTCYSGQLLVTAEGYVSQRRLFSSNKEQQAEFSLDKSYPVGVRVLVDGRPLSGSAVVHFASDSSTASLVLPDSSDVSLSEGSYNISVYVYGNSSVKLPASTKTECVSVPRSGLAGFLGATEQRCFEVTTPETPISYALRGGGISSTYFLSSELARGNITLFVQSLPLPTSFEQLQTNFESFSEYGVEVSFT